MTTKHRRFAMERVDFEVLEDRQLLAAFGTPWPEARSLTVSYPDDGTPIGNFSSSLRQTLDSVTSRENWLELSLRAFQTWAVHADINVGLRNDHNLDFGAPGLMVADPRFGDFRIGAFPQPGALANVVPFQALAGTHSGDILVNSLANYTYHDWTGGVGPAGGVQLPDQWDLFSVLLHETGNALGLDDNGFDWTVMFNRYTVPKGILSQQDIEGIQSLYGARTDPYELVSNDQLAVATLIPTPIGFLPDSEVINIDGSLVSSADVDHYEFSPLPGQDQVTISLRAAGISLLKSRIEVYGAAGQLLAESVTTSVLDNDHVLDISNLSDHGVLYVRVSAADTDVFSVGDYQLRLDYRDVAVKAADLVPASYDAGVDVLYSNFDLADSELGANDTVADHQVLPAAKGLAQANRFELQSAVSAAGDVDVFKVVAPATASDRLLIQLAPLGSQQPDLRLKVVDQTGSPIGVLGKLRSDGSWVMEVAQAQPGEEFYLQISVDPNSVVSVGNYVAVAEFAAPSQQMYLMSSGDVSSDVDDFIAWTAKKSKLFRFDLAVQGAVNSEAVQLTIYDAFTQEVRAILTSQSNRTRSAFAWLSEGDYIIRFSAVSRVGQLVTGVQYQLSVDGLSDDQNPVADPSQPTEDYYYDNSYHYDPGSEPPPDDPNTYGYYYGGSPP